MSSARLATHMYVYRCNKESTWLIIIKEAYLLRHKNTLMSLYRKSSCLLVSCGAISLNEVTDKVLLSSAKLSKDIYIEKCNKVPTFLFKFK